jgi:hypothetical protein
MACNVCENTFNANQSVLVTINKVGTNAYLYVGNQGKNIVLLARIILCRGGGLIYLRAPPAGVSWSYPTPYLEPGITALFYTLTGVAAGTILQAQAEYVEIDGRARSCVTV